LLRPAPQFFRFGELPFATSSCCGPARLQPESLTGPAGKTVYGTLRTRFRGPHAAFIARVGRYRRITELDYSDYYEASNSHTSSLQSIKG